MSKKKIFLIIGIFWIVIIAVFIGSKELTLKTGNEILLKAAPVDPRDLFRGDYVILEYEISTIDTGAVTFDIPDIRIEDKIYVTLDVDKYKIGNISSISKQKPANGNFIKGTIKSVHKESMIIEYGIESYFVPEGLGGEIERNREKLYTKVAIDKFGNAVIKSLIMNGEEVNYNY